ncbi:hypothetical protein O0L34_g837 [Tuta absoluta]|nr:hypothetical protein O0L34_g837 [Tuta absoluta]
MSEKKSEKMLAKLSKYYNTFTQPTTSTKLLTAKTKAVDNKFTLFHPKPSTSERRKAVTENKPSITDQKKANVEHKPSLVRHKPSTSDQKKAYVEHKKSSVRHKLSNSDQKKANVEHKSSSVQRKPSSTDQKKANVEHKSSSVQRKPSSTDQKKANVEHKSSSVRHKPSTSGQKKANVEHKPSSVRHKPSSTDQKKANVEHKSSSVRHKPSTSGQKKANAEHKPSSVRHKQPIVELQKGGVEQKQLIVHQKSLKAKSSSSNLLSSNLFASSKHSKNKLTSKVVKSRSKASTSQSKSSKNTTSLSVSVIPEKSSNHKAEQSRFPKKDFNEKSSLEILFSMKKGFHSSDSVFSETDIIMNGKQSGHDHEEKEIQLKKAGSKANSVIYTWFKSNKHTKIKKSQEEVKRSTNTIYNFPKFRKRKLATVIEEDKSRKSNVKNKIRPCTRIEDLDVRQQVLQGGFDPSLTSFNKFKYQKTKGAMNFLKKKQLLVGPISSSQTPKHRRRNTKSAEDPDVSKEEEEIMCSEYRNNIDRLTRPPNKMCGRGEIFVSQNYLPIG